MRLRCSGASGVGSLCLGGFFVLGCRAYVDHAQVVEVFFELGAAVSLVGHDHLPGAVSSGPGPVALSRLRVRTKHARWPQ